MIRRLRTTHRWAVTLLGVLAPAIFLSALTGRHARAVNPELPGRPSSREVSAAVGNSRDWPGLPLELTVREDGMRQVLEIAALEELTHPDLLVYWQPGETAVGDVPGAGAVLLGSLDGLSPLRIPLPVGTHDSEGVLLLYSLAHGEIIGQRKVPAYGSREDG